MWTMPFTARSSVAFHNWAFKAWECWEPQGAESSVSDTPIAGTGDVLMRSSGQAAAGDGSRALEISGLTSVETLGRPARLFSMFESNEAGQAEAEPGGASNMTGSRGCTKLRLRGEGRPQWPRRIAG